MNVIEMKKSERVGHKVTNVVLTLPFFYVAFMGVKVMSTKSAPSSAVSLGIGMFLVASFFICVFLLIGFKKLNMKIEYDNETINFYREDDPIKIKIKEITQFSNYYYIVQNYRGSIGFLYLRLIKENGETVDIKHTYYKHEELEKLFKHCKKIDPNIKDDFFKFFKYGQFIPEEGWYEYKKRMKADNYKTPNKEKRF